MASKTTDPRFLEIKALADACKNGHTKKALRLLELNPEVLDSPDRDSRFIYPESCLWSPLGIAAEHGHLPLVTALLELGANPVPYEFSAQYHQETYWDWPERRLLEKGHAEIAHAIRKEIARQYGPPLDSANIREAVLSRSADQVAELVREKPERALQSDAAGNTALHTAIAHNKLETARVLLKAGSRVNARNGDGRTPAVVALFGLHRWWRNEIKLEILELLRSHGADYSILVASALGDLQTVTALLRQDPALANSPDSCFRRPLSAATEGGHTEIVRILLTNGADPNAREPLCQGGNSLHIASRNGFLDIARMLLDHGATPQHWVDSAGDSLYAAHSEGHEELLNLLYSHGGTMELLVYAASYRIDVIAEVLNENPSRANEVFPPGWDEDGTEEQAMAIMRLAIRHGARFEKASGWNLRWTAVQYPRLFQLLQQHGANPDLPLLGIVGDMRKRFPAPASQLKTVEFLVEKCGANVNSRSDAGLTPLSLAARAGHLDIVEYLLSQGAALDPDGPDWTKPTALARHHGHHDILRLLERTRTTR